VLLLGAAAGAGHLKLQDFITMFNGVDAEPPAMPEQVRRKSYPIKLSTGSSLPITLSTTGYSR
jgi:hypothetical protein